MTEKVIITGLVRTGTTFLANYLNSQENIVMYSEFLLPVFRNALSLGIHCMTQEISLTHRNILLSIIKADAINVGIREIDDMTSGDFNDLLGLFSAVLDRLSDNNTKVAGVKVTEIDTWLPDIFANTDIKVIYLYRDPRDFLLSSRNRFSDYNMYGSALRYNSSVYNALSLRNSNMLMLRYEDLILEPRKISSLLSGFLVARVDPEISELINIRYNGWINNSSFHDITRLFDSRAVYRWRSNPAAEEVIFIESCYRNVLNKLGYDTARRNVSVRYRILNYLYTGVPAKIYRKLIPWLLPVRTYAVPTLLAGFIVKLVDVLKRLFVVSVPDKHL